MQLVEGRFEKLITFITKNGLVRKYQGFLLYIYRFLKILKLAIVLKIKATVTLITVPGSLNQKNLSAKPAT